MFDFKKILFLFLLVFVLGAFCMFTACTSSENENIIKINDKEFKVELARTDEETYRGLSFREELCSDCAMLFIFPEARERTFVMRNMLIPLDIIFIRDNKIINIHKNLEPEGKNYKGRYSSDGPANYVLEINAGLSDTFGIKKGDDVFIDIGE